MKCPNCCYLEEDDSFFCSECGQFLSDGETISSPEVAPAVLSPPTTSPVPDEIGVSDLEKISRMIQEQKEPIEKPSNREIKQPTLIDEPTFSPKFITANKIAIIICIIFSLLILGYGSKGGVRLTIFVTSFSALFVLFLLVENEGSLFSDKLAIAFPKAIKFTAAVFMVVILRNCAAQHSVTGGGSIECEYGLGGMQICRRAY